MEDPALEKRTLRPGIGIGKGLNSGLDKEEKPAPYDLRPKTAPKLEPINSRSRDTKEGRLANKLVEAKGDDFKKALQELKESKGGEYTGHWQSRFPVCRVSFATTLVMP